MSQKTDAQLASLLDSYRATLSDKVLYNTELKLGLIDLIHSKVNNDKINVAGGVLGLDGTGKIPDTYKDLVLLPSLDALRAKLVAYESKVYRVFLTNKFVDYYHDADDVLSVDDGDEVIVTLNGLRFIKAQAQGGGGEDPGTTEPALVTPEQFGAVGDGSTNDSAAWQACVNSVKATGGTIYCNGKASYKIEEVDFTGIGYDKMIIIQGNSCRFIGDFVFKKTVADQTAAETAVSSTIRIYNATFTSASYLSTSTITGTAINMRCTLFAVVSGCHFLGYETSHVFRFGLFSRSEMNRITNCKNGTVFTFGDWTGANSFNSQSNVSVSYQERYFGSLNNTEGRGFSFIGVSDCKIEMATVEGNSCKYGIYFNNDASTVVMDFFISGLHTEANTCYDSWIYWRGSGSVKIEKIYQQVPHRTLKVKAIGYPVIDISHWPNALGTMTIHNDIVSTRYTFSHMPSGIDINNTVFEVDDPMDPEPSVKPIVWRHDGTDYIEGSSMGMKTKMVFYEPPQFTHLNEAIAPNRNVEIQYNGFLVATKRVGLYAQRPSLGTFHAGHIFLATDLNGGAGQLIFWNGTDWQNVPTTGGFSGAYADLTGKPSAVAPGDFHVSAFTGSYNDLEDLPPPGGLPFTFNNSAPFTILNDTVSSDLKVSEAIDSRIAAAVSSAGSVLTGWINIMQAPYNAVADGGYGTGTSIHTALIAAMAAATDGTIIYIPRGKFRLSSTITWRSDIRVFLWCVGDIYVDTNVNGFIFNGHWGIRQAVFQGSLYGKNTNAEAIPDYTGITSAGIDIQDSWNNEYVMGTISGFEAGIRIGGVQSGSTEVKGSQYNRVWFNHLQRNRIGVHLWPRGGSTYLNGNWCNENSFFGRRITGKIGVKFQKDTTQGDWFNGNKFHDFGFEFAGGTAPMDTGIQAEFCGVNTFYAPRWEPTGVTEKIDIADDCIGMQFVGGTYGADWFKAGKSGQNTHVFGSIWEGVVNGIQIGNYASGYHSVTGSAQNGRVKIFGNKRSPSVATALATNAAYANIDVEWSEHTTETALYNSGNSYVHTAGLGITDILSTSGEPPISGNNKIVLKTAVANYNTAINIVNTHATAPIDIAQAADPAVILFTVAPLTTATFKMISGTWRQMVKWGGTTTGGSSQWIDHANGIYYGSRIGAGVVPDAGAYITGKASTSTIASLLLQVGVQLAVAKNGAFVNDGTDLWMGINAVMRKFLMQPPGGGALQMLRKNAAGTDFEYINNPIFQEYEQSAHITISNSVETSIIGGAKALVSTHLAVGDKVVAEGGATLTGGLAGQLKFIIGGNTITVPIPNNNPIVNKGIYWKCKYVVKSTGTNSGGFLNILILSDGQDPITVNENLSAGFNTVAPSINVLWQWTGSAGTYTSLDATITTFKK
jgi:hypothetical protein